MISCRRCKSECGENDSICPGCGVALYDFDDKNVDYKMEENAPPIIDPMAFFHLFVFVSILVLAMVICICIALW